MSGRYASLGFKNRQPDPWDWVGLLFSMLFPISIPVLVGRLSLSRLAADGDFRFVQYQKREKQRKENGFLHEVSRFDGWSGPIGDSVRQIGFVV
jgi:hypothetical protein